MIKKITNVSNFPVMSYSVVSEFIEFKSIYSWTLNPLSSQLCQVQGSCGLARFNKNPPPPKKKISISTSAKLRFDKIGTYELIHWTNHFGEIRLFNQEEEVERTIF